ncbi:hypothetical protein FMEAI12_3380020 [Parafrankia sp. Ea1.12]|nr:hypothetical protein FMEAI12_3380020 [Parafrankia sp. Ea1.12]
MLVDRADRHVRGGGDRGDRRAGPPGVRHQVGGRDDQSLTCGGQPIVDCGGATVGHRRSESPFAPSGHGAAPIRPLRTNPIRPVTPISWSGRSGRSGRGGPAGDRPATGRRGKHQPTARKQKKCPGKSQPALMPVEATDFRRHAGTPAHADWQTERRPDTHRCHRRPPAGISHPMPPRAGTIAAAPPPRPPICGRGMRALVIYDFVIYAVDGRRLSDPSFLPQGRLAVPAAMPRPTASPPFSRASFRPTGCAGSPRPPSPAGPPAPRDDATNSALHVLHRSLPVVTVTPGARYTETQWSL